MNDEPAASPNGDGALEFPPGNATRASLTFASLTFSDGSKFELAADDIVVFVGPNNAGKSAALRELELQVRRNRKRAPGGLKVVPDATLRQTGTVDDLRDLLESKSRIGGDPNNPAYIGYRYNVQIQHLEQYWTNHLEQLAPFFCTRIATESRITDSNPASGIPLLDNPPQHPIHILQLDDSTEQRIGGYFRRAFGLDLFIYRGGGSEVPLFVGQRPSFLPGEDRISTTYLKRVREGCSALQGQGDGMRSFVSVVLGVLTVDHPSITLLDEPEAFLHPPQARLIGEFIGKERRMDRQLFVATHSVDVLQGLLNGASSKLRIFRIQRTGDTNHVHELDKSRTQEIARDPLLKYSSVFQGIFHRHVFICESDADCMFYNSLLELPEIQGEKQPDAIFIHAGGKHRMAKLAAALRALDIPVTVVADLDLLNEDSTFRTLFETLGGSWQSVESDWRALKKAIEEQKPWLNALEVAKAISAELKDAPESGPFPRDKAQRIKRFFRSASPWDSIKHGGKSNIPSGQATQQFDRIDANCHSIGLWLVPVGELEGFCRSVEATHGPAWVQKILETKDLARDAELALARKFVTEFTQQARE